MNRKIYLIILPIFMAVVLCALPFLSLADTYTHNFTDLQGLYINNVIFIHDKENTTSDILSISRILSFGETFNSLQDTEYDDAIISYMEEYDSSVPVPFKVDSIVSLQPIGQDIDEAIPNGSTDIILHFECFMLCGSTAVHNPGQITNFTYNNIINFSAIHPDNVNDIGNYHGPYRTSTYSTWKNRLFKISFDFYSRTGFSFLASTSNFGDDGIYLYTYDPVLSVTYNNDFGVGDTADDIAALDENLRQTLEEQTAAITSSISSQTISINNNIDNLEQTIAEGQEDIIDGIADMYSGLSQDNDVIIGYLEETFTKPGYNISYEAYIKNHFQDSQEEYDDLKDFEDALNNYINRTKLADLKQFAETAFQTYGDGFFVWKTIINEMVNHFSHISFLVYSGLFITLFSLVFSLGVSVVGRMRSNFYHERGNKDD